MQKASFFPYNWHIDESQEEFTSIRVYGLNKKNENVCVRVDDFTPYVYIELPTSRVRWTATKAQILGDKLDSLMGRQKPVKKALTWKKKLYGAHINPDTGERKLYPYLFCSFYNIKDLTVLGYRLKGSVHVVGLGSLKLKIHESDANPILQMTCCRKLPTAGWVKFQGRKIREDEMDTLCDHEYQVKYKHLAPLDCNIVPRPKIMGFDIEVNSWNPSAMPVATDSRNKVFQISCVMAREGDGPDDYDKYILSLGDPDEKIVGYDVIVYTYPTEAELLTGFTELVREENPNIITGYNILGFDIPYMIARAKNTFCLTDFSKQGFHKYAKAVEKTIKWSSSAYKNQEFQFLDAEGRVYVDLLPLVRRDFKFNNYKLKTISTYFLGQTKDPLSVKGIFKCYRIGTKKNKKGEYGKKARRAMGLVARYCVQDSVLVVRLMDKLKTWVGLTEMAKTCQVPIFTLYTQGQQIKVYSQMYKYCMFQNIVVEKDAYTVAENERYVGAKVFLPIPGKYKMVVPFDFASLYPTTIIAYNIDYHTWVPDDSSIPDHKCHVMEWEDHQACQHDPKVQRKIVLTEYLATERAKIKAMRDRRNKCLDKLRRKNMMIEINKEVEKLKPYTLERAELTKTISKITMCEKRRYRFLKEPKGVMPTILQNLLDARKHTRKVDMARVKKEIKSLEDSKEDNTDLIVAQKTLLDVLNKRQLSYKVSANSVGATTPIPCELNGEFVYRTIEEISKGDWKRINEEQEVSTPLDGLRVWSDLGFTVPKYVMRHPQDGKLIRTVTHTGMVETTNDHSLLRPNGDEVKPRDLRVGDKLMHHPTPLPTDTPREPLFRTISNDVIKNYKLETPKEEMAFVYGLFMAEGTAGTWGKRLSEKSSWIIYNSDIDLLERACEILNRLESVGENTFKIVLYPSNKDQSAKLDMYHLTCRGKVKKLCKKYRELLYDTRSHKKIPDYILASSLDVRQAFLMGYYSGDGARRLKCGVILRNKGHRVSAQLMYLARSLGYKVSVNYPEKKQTLISRLQCSTRLARDSESIKLIYPANTLNSLKPGEKIIRNGQLIQHVDGQSEYRRITLICDRLPRQKLLDSLDDAIEKAARIRKCYITEYNSKRKRLKLVKYCCGATHWVLLSSIKKELPWAFKRDGWCDCKHTTETNYNVVNEYKDEVPCDEYVYDIETENHHFAAGVGDIIVHNSMYGITGTRRGYLPFMPAAMCTTYMGRKNITRVAEELTHNHKGRLIYGDTDTLSPYTPLLILENDKMSYKMIEEISDGKWAKTVTGKEISQAKPGIKVWSDKGFTDIVHVIRHAVEKPMIRVLTHTGVVICTLDHSLLWENGKAALGSDISIGDKLCHRKLPVPDDTPPEPVYPNRLTAEKIRDYVISDAVYEGLSASLAFVWGVFFADGSCGSYKQKNGIRNIWTITKGDNLLLERCLDILTTYEPSLDFKILDTMKSSKANKLVPKQKSRKKEHRGTIKILVEKYRKLFYNDKKYKIVPDIILNAPYKIREAFFMGYYAGDGSKKDPALTITNKGEIGTAGMFFLMRSLGYKVSINTRGDKPDVYKITGSTPSKKFRYESNAVKKIDDYTNEFDYIYDIETANHHFAAGIGEMVVHNSNYIQFPHLNNATETWDYAIDVADKITKLFPPPIQLEFEEEIYAFFLILSKKRYMYRKCLRDGVVDDKIGKKGVLLARRDNSKFVRDVYEGVVSMIASHKDCSDILYFVLDQINQMCSGSKPYTDFIITKSVGDHGGLLAKPIKDKPGKAMVGDYTVPLLSRDKEERDDQMKKKKADSPQDFYLLCLPAQVQLAERMRRRGKRVDPGTRLEYVVTNPDQHTAKQYEKIESADYMARHRNIIRLDYMYYLKALVNPLDQVLDVSFKDEKTFRPGFTMRQYKYRWKVRAKLIHEIQALSAPRLVFK